MTKEQADNIVAWVNASGKKHNALAAEAGIARWTLYRILGGRAEHVQLDTIEKLAAVLNAPSIEALLNTRPEGEDA